MFAAPLLLELPTLPPSKLAVELETILQDTVEQGFTLVFTDGSSEKFDEVGRLGGYGVFSQDGQSIAEHMPIGMKQTNNAAELMAALRALQLHTTGKVTICSDSEYVLLRVCGAAKRWKVKGWVGSCGPVSNVPIWEEVLLELDRNKREFVWIKVPSHVTVEGNNEADRLASIGLHSHPLYPFNPAPHKEATHFGTPPPPLKRSKIEACTPSALDVSKAIDFSVASPSAVPLHSARGESILQSVQLEALSDPDTDDTDTICTDSGLDLGASDTASTVSWVCSSDSRLR